MTSWWVAVYAYYLCTLCKRCVLLCLTHLIGCTGTDNSLSHHLCRRLKRLYSHFRNYAPPLDVKGGIITKKVFPVFSESFFWTCFGLVMYIWVLMDVTEKLAFQMWKNNIDLPGFMGELLRGGIFTVKKMSVNMPPPFYRKYAPPH